MTQKYLDYLKTNNFPIRTHDHDDITNYLARIDESYSPELRICAREFEVRLEEAEDRLGHGPSVGQMIVALDKALDLYSPKSN